MVNMALIARSRRPRMMPHWETREAGGRAGGGRRMGRRERTTKGREKRELTSVHIYSTLN